MAPSLPHGLRKLALGIADSAVTMPVMRWTWRGLADDAFGGELPELRPADRETVRDMMSGRYLLASKLIETDGASPFAMQVDHVDWWLNLHGFSWLRHFRDVRDPGERLFARMLVLDWIGHEAQFQHDTWAPALTAQRILNWLRHLPLLLDGANPAETRTIQRVLGAQIQSLKVRAPLTSDRAEALFAHIALLAAEYCEQNDKTDVPTRVERLNVELADQLDSDGMHLSRNPRLQLQLLVELVSIRPIAASVKSEAGNELVAQIDRMHESLDALTLSSGEPVYFNGCGHLPHDVLIAIQANGPTRKHRSMLLGGYGILRDGNAVVIADSGLAPPPGLNSDLHSSALAFEFSHGTELILGSCGPAPSDLPQSKALFRQGVAHSAPTIDAEDVPPQRKPDLVLESADNLLALTTTGYARRFGVEIERRITLLSGGTTLVGQDHLIASGNNPSGLLALRFHLAPGVMVRRNPGEGIVRLVLPNDAVWSFLWEGAELREEESVRQSAYVGFHKTRQLVLEVDVAADAEVAWIFTLEQG
ncbi:MAG: heparinase II/III family protein [Candidatus Devosia phytovorans]|uniref:Heparinase II/III family protein n=1 Tax=Candidatus Devosia phytovorans TaxID=3121372 RepID=A0AAJ6AZ48_9HYPH|nr:heparinase II/III family protein [Devosia sp.]WEK04220.1 MAG: heparinase II/III family protein [Devosia sp.]